jgi:hypothetical protein
MHHGVCDGSILRARLDSSQPDTTIEPYSWGYRNGYAIRFAPRQHGLQGQLLVGEDGADERGARPSNNAPDNLQLAIPNPDGISWLAGSVRIPVLEPGSVQSDRRPRR